MHLFLSSSKIAGVWQLIAKFWDSQCPTSNTISSLIKWTDSFTLNGVKNKVFDTMTIVTFSVLWRYRNNLIFGTVKLKKSEIFHDILSLPFFGFRIGLNLVTLVVYFFFEQLRYIFKKARG